MSSLARVITFLWVPGAIWLPRISSSRLSGTILLSGKVILLDKHNLVIKKRLQKAAIIKRPNGFTYEFRIKRQ